MVKNQINSTSISIEIEVPPKEIWNAVSDVTRVSEWSPECVQVIWKKPPSDNLIGAKFIGSNKRGWMRWKGYCEVTGALPEKTSPITLGLWVGGCAHRLDGHGRYVHSLILNQWSHFAVKSSTLHLLDV